MSEELIGFSFIEKTSRHNAGVVRDKIRGYVFESIHILFVFCKN